MIYACVVVYYYVLYFQICTQTYTSMNDINFLYVCMHTYSSRRKGLISQIGQNSRSLTIGSNVYTSPNMEIITPSRNVLDLGIYVG